MRKDIALRHLARRVIRDITFQISVCLVFLLCLLFPVNYGILVMWAYLNTTTDVAMQQFNRIDIGSSTEEVVQFLGYPMSVHEVNCQYFFQEDVPDQKLCEVWMYALPREHKSYFMKELGIDATENAVIKKRTGIYWD